MVELAEPGCFRLLGKELSHQPVGLLWEGGKRGRSRRGQKLPHTSLPGAAAAAAV